MRVLMVLYLLSDGSSWNSSFSVISYFSPSVMKVCCSHSPVWYAPLCRLASVTFQTSCGLSVLDILLNCVGKVLHVPVFLPPPPCIVWLGKQARTHAWILKCTSGEFALCTRRLRIMPFLLLPTAQSSLDLFILEVFPKHTWKGEVG